MENRPDFSSIIDDRPEFLRDPLAFKPLSPEKLAERVSQIKVEMEAHQGEFFLSVEREWHFPGCTGFGYRPKEEDYRIQETVFMGLCTEPYLTVRDSDLELHTPYYVWPYPMGIYKKDKKEGSIIRYSFELERPLPKKREKWGLEVRREPGLALEIFVGDKEVFSWFLTHYKGKDMLVYPRMAAMLGRSLLELPAPIQEVIHQRKQEILENLLSLVGEDKKLAAQIKRIYQVPEKGGVLYEGGALTLVEDADDAFFVTWGQREELVMVRERAKRILTKAIELGMHKGEEVLRREIRPGQTVEIDIAKFIRGFCEYYEVPIPHDQG